MVVVDVIFFFLLFLAAIWIDLMVVVGCGLWVVTMVVVVGCGAIGFGSWWRSILGIGLCGDCI